MGYITFFMFIIIIILFIMIMILYFKFKYFFYVGDAYIKLIQSIVSEFDSKDPYFNGHTRKVNELSCEIAKRLGINESDFYKNMKLSIYISQLAKIRIPEKILYKREKLTEDEFNVIKKTPIIAYKITENNYFFKKIKNVVKSKNEKYNGRGYPEGLLGEDIPIMSRIINVAEAYDAMVSERPYKKPLTKSEAIEELKNQKGKQFDPEVTDVILEILLEEELNI